MCNKHADNNFLGSDLNFRTVAQDVFVWLTNIPVDVSVVVLGRTSFCKVSRDLCVKWLEVFVCLTKAINYTDVCMYLPISQKVNLVSAHKVLEIPFPGQ